jgi:hypothetical protein
MPRVEESVDICQHCFVNNVAVIQQQHDMTPFKPGNLYKVAHTQTVAAAEVMLGLTPDDNGMSAHQWRRPTSPLPA